MRKIAFGFILVFSFILSGCEFIPEEYRDQLGEYFNDYCEENPEEDVCDLDLTTTELEKYFADYNDSSLSNEELAEKYFDGEMPEDLMEERNIMMENGITLRLDDVVINVDGSFEVTYSEVTADSEACCRKRPGRIEYREGGVSYTWYDGVDDDCDRTDHDTGIDDDCDLVTDEEEALVFFEGFFTDFVNREITNEEFTRLYFETDMPEDLKIERNAVLEADGIFEEVMILLQEDGTYEVTYSFRIGNDKVVRKRPGRIRQRPDLLLSEWDSLIEEQIE